MIRRALIGLACLIAGAALWVRFAPSDPARWHVDPLRAVRSSTPNDAMLALSDSPVFDLSPRALLGALDKVAQEDGRVRVLARDEDRVTYVQRSALMGFPDYISVRALSLCGRRSMLAIWSRARFGYSDMGVNAARIARWMAALSAQIPSQPQGVGRDAPDAPPLKRSSPAQRFGSAALGEGRKRHVSPPARPGAYRAPFPANLGLEAKEAD